MKLKQVIKLKFLYLFNRNTLIILGINVLFLLFSFIMEATGYDKSDSYEDIIASYVSNSFLYIKILMVFFNVYLYSYTISFKNDFLVYLLIPLGVKKEESISVSIIINILMNLMIFILLFIIFSYTGISLKEFYVKYEYLETFVYIYLISGIYGLYSMALMQVCSNFFVIIIVMSIFIVTNNMSSNELGLFERVVLAIFPNINEDLSTLYSVPTAFILLALLFLLNVIIYKNRDLNF